MMVMSGPAPSDAPSDGLGVVLEEAGVEDEGNSGEAVGGGGGRRASILASGLARGSQRKKSLLKEIALRTLHDLKERRRSDVTEADDGEAVVSREMQEALRRAEEEAKWKKEAEAHEAKQRQLLADDKKLKRARRATQRRRPAKKPTN